MPKVNHKARLAELRSLRQSGKKTFDNYQIDEADAVFDEVDEDGYKKLVRERLNQDDFVVDDNGEGYADDGREDWDRTRVYESDSEADDIDMRGRPSKGGSSYSFRRSLYVTDLAQLRRLGKTSRHNAMPTIEISASILPRGRAKSSQSRRSSKRKMTTTSWLVFLAK